jgi:hypothetical protein
MSGSDKEVTGTLYVARVTVKFADFKQPSRVTFSWKWPFIKLAAKVAASDPTNFCMFEKETWEIPEAGDQVELYKGYVGFVAKVTTSGQYIYALVVVKNSIFESCSDDFVEQMRSARWTTSPRGSQLSNR